MGGVPVLLMIAAMGITYGWQPDNSGGVEYIIQIPPDQLHEIERIGEVSSVIDPAVRGHVSRVIVQVGDAPLPRQTPATFANRTNPRPVGKVIAASDLSPVPVPAIGDSRKVRPIPSLDPSELSGQKSAAVMKPDANDPRGGSGLSLPATLNNAATGAVGSLRNDVDRAARDLGNRASNQFNAALTQTENALRGGAANALGTSPIGRSSSASTNRVQPPAPQSRQNQTPQFTGSDPTGEFARTRQGGPSTDPTPRDNTWRDFSNRRPSGPSTEPVGTTAANANSRLGATGLAPSDTFGKLPSGLKMPSTNTSADRSTGYTGRSSFAQANDNRQASPSVYSQYEQTQIDQQARNTRATGGFSQYNASAAPTPSGGLARGQATGAAGTDATGYGQTGSSFARDSQTPQTRIGPDSRLTLQQIEAGAWSVDIYNQPIDRDGKLVQVPSPNTSAYDPRTRLDTRAQIDPRTPTDTRTQYDTRTQLDPRSQMAPQSQPDTRLQADRYADRTYGSSGQQTLTQSRTPGPSTANVQPPLLRSDTYAYSPSDTRGLRESGSYNSLDPSPPRTDRTLTGSASGVRLDPPSLSSRRASAFDTAGPTSSRIQPKQVAAQPLFNGLLLVSFVANIYLIFWLKNLRVQFRDLVASKRVANPSSQSV